MDDSRADMEQVWDQWLARKRAAAAPDGFADQIMAEISNAAPAPGGSAGATSGSAAATRGRRKWVNGPWGRAAICGAALVLGLAPYVFMFLQLSS